MKTCLLRSLPALALASAALLFGGCATASKPAAMAVSATPTHKHPRSVSVSVTGGSETSSLGASQISNAAFADAVQTSIDQSGLFAKLAPAPEADYALGVQIVRLDQPMFGVSFTVTMESTWRLTHRPDGKIVWEKAIVTPFTASMGDSVVGTTRLRLANEGAARATIQEAIRQMGELTLP